MSTVIRLSRKATELPNREVTVQVPPTPYRWGLNLEQPLPRLRTLAFIGTFVVIGIVVWALAIAKLVDLCRSL